MTESCQISARLVNRVLPGTESQYVTVCKFGQSGTVPNVHDLLQWANRSEVAREITRRGYRVSVETLNRWHRDRREVPAVVERIVFELFGLEATKNAPPEWAERLEAKVDQLVIGTVVDPVQRRALEGLVARLGVLPRPSSAGFDDLPDTEARGTEAPTGQGAL
jgi:hypothetical protein